MISNGNVQHFMAQENETPRLDCAFRATGKGEQSHSSIPGCHDATRKNPIRGSVPENITRLRKNGSRFSKLHTIATWNVRTMSQGKLDIVKLEMERTRADILGISELRWKGIGFFNSNEYTVYYSGNEKFEENG